MRTNTRKKQIFHSAMKAARKADSPGTRRTVKIILAVLALALVFAAYKLCVMTYGKLRAVWEAQCVVTDVDAQVVFQPTPHITTEHVREWFGLSNGCNLARIDLEATRRTILNEHPLIKKMEIAKHLPRNIDITIEERTPIACINLRQPDGPSGLTFWDVVDEEGVVFETSRKESRNLPRIIEKKPYASRGERISGRALTALRLVEIAARPDYPQVFFPEIRTDNSTYLKATTPNYSTVNIAWSILDDSREKEQPALEQILTNFQQLTNQGLYPDRVVYTITDLDRIVVRTND